MLMTDYAISKNLTPFISMQNFHNAAYREEEREMMPTLKVSLAGRQAAGGQVARSGAEIR